MPGWITWLSSTSRIAPACTSAAVSRRPARAVGWMYPPSDQVWGIPACPEEVTRMKLVGLLDAVLADPALATARDLAARGGPDAAQVDLTAPPALRPFVVAAIAAHAGRGAGRTVLAVTATSREAEDLAGALGCLLPAEEVAVYPSWETLPHERLSPRSDTVGRRLAVLRRLAHRGADPLRVLV